MFSAHADSLETFVAGCRPVEGQVGALFAINGRVVGFDLFHRPSTLRKMLPKLVRGAAIDAIDDAAGDADHVSAPLDALARQFLAVVAGAPQHVTPALGLGEDRRLKASHFAGAALVADQRGVHLSGFAL